MTEDIYCYYCCHILLFADQVIVLRACGNCQFSQEKTKSLSPDCHQKQRSRHTNSMEVKTVLTQRGIDTLGLLPIYEM